MSEYGNKENTESYADTTPEVSDAQIDDTVTAEQADVDFDADVDTSNEKTESSLEVEEDQAEEADADFDADTESGFEGSEATSDDHVENRQEESNAENVDADFDQDMDSENTESNAENVDSENTEDDTENVDSENVEDNTEDVDSENVENNSEDIDSENTEDNAENVDSENVEDNTENVDSENTEGNAENVDSENTEDNTENVASENVENNTENVDSVNSEDNAEAVDSENAEDNTENVDSENTEDNTENVNSVNSEDNAEAVDSENTEDNTENVDSENTEDNTENVNSENTEGSTENVDSVNSEDNAEAVDSENTEDNTKNDDSENTEGNTENIDSENTEDNTENVNSENTEDNAENVNSENTEGNTENVDSGNTEDNTENVDSGNTEDNTENVDSGNTEDNTENVDSENTEDNTENVNSENTEDNAENVNSENTEGNTENVDSGNTEDNTENVDSGNTEDNTENVDSENTEDNTENVNSENTEGNSENANSVNSEDNTENVDSQNTEDNAENVNSENEKDNTENVDSENTENNTDNVDSANTENNAENVDSENAEDNAEDIDSENSEDSSKDVDSENTEDNAEDVDSENVEDNTEDVDSENTEDNAEATDSERKKNNAEDGESKNTEDDAEAVESDNANETIEETDDTDEGDPESEESLEEEDVPSEEEEVPPEEKEPLNEEEAEEPFNDLEEEENIEPDADVPQEKAQPERERASSQKAERQPVIAPMPIRRQERESVERDIAQESSTSPVNRGGSQEVATMQYESAAFVSPAELGDTVTPEHADCGDEHKDSEEKSSEEADASSDDDPSASGSPAAQQDEDQRAGQNAANNTQSQNGAAYASMPFVPNGPQAASSTANDPQTNTANPSTTSPQDQQEEAFNALLAYMNAHKYGREDAHIYQNDPEWQKLHKAAYPDWTPPKSAEVRQTERFRPGTIPAASILDVDSSGAYFWQEHSLTKADYLAMARNIPEVQQRLDSGASLDELKKDLRLGVCATAYFDPAEMVKVEHDQNGFHFSDNGRHRIAAARELGIQMPVLILERNQSQTVNAEQKIEDQKPANTIEKKPEVRQQVEGIQRTENKSFEQIDHEEKQTIAELFDHAESVCTPEEEKRHEAQKRMSLYELPGIRGKEASEAGEEDAKERVRAVESTIRALWEKDMLSDVNVEQETLAAARFKEIGKAQPETLVQMEALKKQYQDATAFQAQLAELPETELTHEQQQTLAEGRHAYRAWLEKNKTELISSGLLTETSFDQRIRVVDSMGPSELHTEFGRSATILWDRQNEIVAFDRGNAPMAGAEYILSNGDQLEMQKQFGGFDKRVSACIVAAQNLPVKNPETIRASSEAVIKNWNAKNPDQPISAAFSPAEIEKIGVGAVILEMDGHAEEKIRANWSQALQARQSDIFKIERTNEKASFITSYKQRLSQTPTLQSGRWEGQRGESLCMPKSEEARRILAEHNLNGIQYKDAVPDFTPVAVAQVKLGYMTASRSNTDAVGGRAKNVDNNSLTALNTAYYSPGNFPQADAVLAAQWSAEQKDGKAWTAKDVEQFREKNGLTWHECNDQTTMQLVPSIINKEFSHLGGVGEEKEKRRIMDEVLQDSNEIWSDGTEFETMTTEQLKAYTRKNEDYDERGVRLQQDLNSPQNAEINHAVEVQNTKENGIQSPSFMAIWKNPEKTTPPFESPEYKTMVTELNENQVEYIPIEKYEGVRSSEEIIEQISGGDETDGSCFSSLCAYIGNEAGYNVHDFRGGDSQAYFSSRDTIQKLAQLPGVESKIAYGKDDIACAKHLLSGIEPGKEYCLASGGHAAIVRRNGNHIEYLELQHPGNQNGWHTMTNATLLNRFGCSSQNPYANTNFLIEVESLSKSLDFLSILGYINTEPSKQQKGRAGHVR